MIDTLKQWFWKSCYFLFLMMFVGGVWMINLLAYTVCWFLTEKAGRVLLLACVYRLMGLYLMLMERTGSMACNRRVLDVLRGEPGPCLYIANHPSMMDAPLILSRLPELLCVFKSALQQGLLMRRTTRILGYLSNRDGIDLLRSIVQRLQAGQKVLLFPEGTRTDETPMNPLNQGYALTALRARVPLQLLCIRAAGTTLTKQGHYLKPDRFPTLFHIELGPRIEPGDFTTVKQLNRFVESWLRARIQEENAVMRPFLPPVVNAAEDDGVKRWSFQVPRDPFYCRGHMPDHSLVPGYVQMAWAHECLSSWLASEPSSLEYQRWKFVKPVLPGDQLLLEMQGEAGRLRVRILCDEQVVTQGRVIYTVEGGAS